MTTTHYKPPRVNYETSGAAAFSAAITGDGSTNYTAMEGHFNLGDPDTPSDALIEGVSPVEVTLNANGTLSIQLTQAQVVALPTRPIPYDVWIENGATIIPIQTGRIVVLATAGSDGVPA